MLKENGKIGVRWLALLAIGAVMGANLISPAVAHLGSFAHLKKHFQQRCKPGSVLAYAFVNGNGGDPDGSTVSSTGFSTSGVSRSFNCHGGAIQARQFGTGDYGVRIPGVTTNDPTSGIYIFQSADDHNDGIVNIDTHTSDNYVEVDTFNASDGVDDDADFYLVVLKR
jgi:hypothetical protein